MVQIIYRNIIDSSIVVVTVLMDAQLALSCLWSVSVRGSVLNDIQGLLKVTHCTFNVDESAYKMTEVKSK